MGIKRNVRGSDFDLELELDPPVATWRLVSECGDGASATYSGDDYNLFVTEQAGEHHALVRFSLKRESGEPFTVRRCLVSTETSAANVDRVWIPWTTNKWVEAVGLLRTTQYQANTVPNRSGTIRTSADRGIPIIFALDRSSNVIIAVGYLDQRIETEIEHSVMTHIPSNQDCGTVRIRLRRPISGYSIGPVAEHRDGFFVATGGSWFDTMQTLRAVHDEVCGREMRPSPDAAWEPLLAPWGAAKGKRAKMRHEAKGPDDLVEDFKIASELGIRGMINWTGWFMENLPQFQSREEHFWGWPDYIGDFRPKPEFADLKGFVNRLKELGVISMFWISPWMAGRKTKTRDELKEALVKLDIDHSDPRYNIYTSYLCPRNPITQKYVVDLMAGVVREFGISGYTVDMVEATSLEPCVANHEHNYPTMGLAMADTFARIREAIDAVNPNVVIEFRPAYSNISNLYNATAHRSPDSGEAGSYDMNRRHCVILRSYVPPGVAVHFDPQYWHLDEKIESVAKMLSTMVVSGVPQICADLTNMGDEQRRLVKAWIDFYHQHKEDFRWGQLRPVQNDAQFSTIKVERGKKAFVSYASYPALRVPLNPEAQEIHLFNCTNEDWLHTILGNVSGEFAATVHRCDLSPLVETKLVGLGDSLLVNLGVPQGGLITLKKIGG